MINKKNQIFIFDLIFSFIILVIIIGLFYAYYLDVDENINIYQLNSQIINSFTNVKVNDLNDIEIRNMFISNKITNIENTIAEQVIEFYIENKSNPVYAKNLTKIFIEDYTQKGLNMVLTIENKTGGKYELYRYPEPPEDFSVLFENSTISANNQRLIFTFKNQKEFLGPYIFEVKIWQ